MVGLALLSALREVLSWLLSMSANRFAVSAESPIAGMSSTLATFIDEVSQTIQPLVTFRIVYLILLKTFGSRQFLLCF